MASYPGIVSWQRLFPDCKGNEVAGETAQHGKTIPFSKYLRGTTSYLRVEHEFRRRRIVAGWYRSVAKWKERIYRERVSLAAYAASMFTLITFLQVIGYKVNEPKRQEAFENENEVWEGGKNS